ILAASSYLYSYPPQSLFAIGNLISFAVQPTAEKGYEYGSLHFDARNTEIYDIARARYYFTRAVEIDPSHRNAQHQYARMLFLEGDFKGALEHINIALADDRPSSPSSYYIRGLIEGFAGNYSASIVDYERYLENDPTNWAALNDLAWVLLKDRQYEKAELITSRGLEHFPDNPWLRNSRAIARYELGNVILAHDDLREARAAIETITTEDWLRAYPGNDPNIAPQGLDALKKSIQENEERVRVNLASKRDA
ncbi:MAG: tetratricopeptide repeat protein, partial [Gallionella sp.]